MHDDDDDDDDDDDKDMNYEFPAYLCNMFYRPQNSTPLTSSKYL
jgi:hypothetical protein